MNRDSLLLSCDWGTSSFRLRLVERQTWRVLAEHTSPEGAQTIAAVHRPGPGRRSAFAAVLQRGLRTLKVSTRAKIPLVVSGMACSTIGWWPLPYASVPVQLDGTDFVSADRSIQGRTVRFISGLRATCDVMRGEECELVGLFQNPARLALATDCCVVLPGTHSKHVRLHRGRILGFSTHPTGELFALLSRHSTLCEMPASGFAATAFRAGVHAALQLGLGPALFRTRARSVLGLMRPAHAADFLSGVLIGSEIASLPKRGRVILAAGPNLARRYRLAVGIMHPKTSVTVIPAAEAAHAVVRGHVHLARDL